MCAHNTHETIFRLTDKTTGESEEWIDVSQYPNTWKNIRKIIGAGGEYHTIDECVGRECNNIKGGPFTDPYTIQISNPIFMTSEGLKKTDSCVLPYCVYTDNEQRVCNNQHVIGCLESYVERCWDQYGHKVSCKTKENSIFYPHL